MKPAPLSKKLSQRLVSVTVHGAGTIPVFAADESASRLMLHLRLSVLQTTAFCRSIEMISNSLPIGHASVMMTFMILRSGCVLR